MPAELKFTVLDGTTHVVGFSEHTACGLPIPIGSGWEKTADSLCEDCRTVVDKAPDEYGVGDLPEAKKSKAKKDAG